MDISKNFNHPRYSIIKLIGQGKSGQVWEVKSLANKIYAMKTYSDKVIWQRENAILKEIQAKLAKMPIGERFVSSYINRFGRIRLCQYFAESTNPF